MKIELNVDTNDLTEARLFEYHCVLWNQLPGNAQRSARKHFEDRFKLAGLPHSQQYLSKVFDGTAHMGDEAWAIVTHDADGQNKNKVAAALRARWLACCERRATL